MKLHVAEPRANASLALDHGSAALAVGNTPLTTEQRGRAFAGVLDGYGTGAWVVDIGAVESTGAGLLSPNSSTNTLRATLQWGAVAGVASYKIWADDLSTATSGYYVSTTTSTSQTFTSDFALEKYRAWIRPFFASGRGNWSAPKDIYVLLPAVFQAMPTLQWTSSPTLIWNALPGAVAYDVWIDNVSTGEEQFIRQNVVGTSFTPTAEFPLGMYRAFVRGVDAIGNLRAIRILIK